MLKKTAELLGMLPVREQIQTLNVVFTELNTQPWLTQLERQLLKEYEIELRALITRKQIKAA